jgi:hypothetical protein
MMFDIPLAATISFALSIMLDMSTPMTWRAPALAANLALYQT